MSTRFRISPELCLAAGSRWATADGTGGVCRHNLARPKPVEQHPDAGELELDGSRRNAALQILDVGRDVDGLHVAQMLDAVTLTRPRIRWRLSRRPFWCGFLMFAVKNSRTRRAVGGSGAKRAGRGRLWFAVSGMRSLAIASVCPSAVRRSQVVWRDDGDVSRERLRRPRR